MNNEIKREIDFIKQILNQNELIRCSRYFNDLLDYITNLQQENHELKSKLECYENGAYYSSKVDELEQENEYLKKQNDEKTKIGVADHKYASQMEDKVIELQQENERLKELIDADNESYDIQEVIINRQKSELLEQEDYKLRCEKASDNLKRNYWINEHEHNDDVVNMTLNILQNGSDASVED